ncbi:hypothetical protein [Konateibacter massiliensis]|uniref:hypothetical protein n=1 Tax=Konateibacter massiliensis TaxID=2002841 RepID=UPI000C160739|nr:hypothetical protein [Konateibacter massiliensis]
MLDKNNFVSFNFLKKESYTGSMKGMRYRLNKEAEPEVKLKVTIWPEPYSYEMTKEEKKQTAEFEFSKEGEEAAVEWLNEQYEAQKELWDSVNPHR